MKIKLFVDDIRAAPEGWVRARTVTEAIRFLAEQDVEEVSLDHDIACRTTWYHNNTAVPIEHSSEETFEPVARYIVALGLSPYYIQIKVRIHTSNFTAGRRMAEILSKKDYMPYVYNQADYEPDSKKFSGDLPERENP